MYTLRRVTSTGVAMNHSLGNEYTFIGRAYSYEEFKRTFKEYFDKDHVADLDKKSDKETKNVFGFVAGRGGSYIQPLYSNQTNFIVTENGRTLERLKI
jgi:hypothetical protein